MRARNDETARGGGWLAALVSEAAVFGAAQMVHRGFAVPDGREWLPRVGAVADA